jgi:hypothetical protein
MEPHQAGQDQGQLEAAEAAPGYAETADTSEASIKAQPPYRPQVAEHALGPGP